MRTSETLTETLKSRIPGLSKSLPVRRDVFGKAVETPGGRLNLIDPFAHTTAREHPVINEAKRIDYAIGLPSKSMFNDKLTNAEYSDYVKVQGRIIEETLKEVIELDQYKSLNVEEQKDLMNDTINKIRKEVKQIMYPAFVINRYDLPEGTDLYRRGERQKCRYKWELE